MKQLARLLVVAIALLAGQAYAACSSPAGTAGQMTFATNLGVMVFCDGSNWISMAGSNSGGGGGSSSSGSSGDIQYSNGSGGFSADTGVFTYSSGLLKSTSISATNISGTTATLSSIGAGNITASGNVLGAQVSATNVSLTLGQYNAQTVTNLVGGGGNTIVSGTSSVSVSSAGTIQMNAGGTNVLALNNYGLGVNGATANSTYTVNVSGSIQVIGGSSGIVVYGNTYAMQGLGAAGLGNGVYGKSGITSGWGMAGVSQNGSIVGYLGYNNAWGIYCSATGGTCGGNQNWTNNSDVRLKTDIQPLTDDKGLTAIMKLRPVTYRWRDVREAQKGLQLGFIAQDVEKVFPQVISTMPSTTIKLSGGASQVVPDPKGIAYSEIVIPLVKAVQELKADNDTLRAKNNSLQTNLDQLRHDVDLLKAKVNQ